MQVHLHTRLRNPHPPATHRGLRRLEGDAVPAGCPRDCLGVFEGKLDLLGAVALPLHQQLVACVAVGHDPCRLVAFAQGRLGDGGVGQSQRYFAPSLGDDLDLHHGLDANDPLLGHRFVFHLRD